MDGGGLVVEGCRVGRYEIEETPLWVAASNGQVQTARGLLAGGEVDRATADTGGTPLLQAAQEGFVDVAKLLLEHRADPNRLTVDSVTPLLFAAQKGFVDLAKVLLEHRADPNKAHGRQLDPPPLGVPEGPRCHRPPVTASERGRDGRG